MDLLRIDAERFSNIQRIYKRYIGCDSREEIVVRIDFLKKALSGKLD
tara:strand:+ start:6182 stop:6322 length:141 start_codon:yes stop_codon:yes gene_type:complete